MPQRDRHVGLALAAIATCAGVATISGSSVASAATMGRIALPEMLKNRYNQAIATGVVAAGGTLGVLIPPSIVLAIYGTLAEVDIGALFIAGVLPGIFAAFLYGMGVMVVGWVSPTGCRGGIVSARASA